MFRIISVMNPLFGEREGNVCSMWVKNMEYGFGGDHVGVVGVVGFSLDVA